MKSGLIKENIVKQLELAINAFRSGQTDGKLESLNNYGDDEVNQVLAFHKSLSGYSPTPLVNLKNLAADLGLARVHLKDESKRFGLNAFKVLGGSYAMGRILANKIGTPISKLSFEALKSEEVKAKTGVLTFVTATDGNHGRGVAWAAAELGHKAVVFMPKGSASVRADNIRATGAECFITDLNYDDAVRAANAFANDRGGVMIQDTAWEGYMDIPLWITQGYMTLAQEILDQLNNSGEQYPTHVFLQAGVGSFAGAVLGRLKNALGDKAPVAVIVEPHQANCYYQSFKANDGKPRFATGLMETIMAGLACGEPSLVSWGVLRDYSAASISCADHIAANGMRLLAAPIGDDPIVVSGESGAVTAGVLEYLYATPEGRKIGDTLGLTADSRVLLISTEGDTLPSMYRQIVWYGRYGDTERERKDD
jgi:diaminopropionate ammonia-lyase